MSSVKKKNLKNHLSFLWDLFLWKHFKSFIYLFVSFFQAPVTKSINFFLSKNTIISKGNQQAKSSLILNSHYSLFENILNLSIKNQINNLSFFYEAVYFRMFFFIIRKYKVLLPFLEYNICFSKGKKTHMNQY